MPFMREIKTQERFAGGAGEVAVELFDYSGDLVIYRGVNSNPHALTSDETWYISKLSYNVDQVVTVEYREEVAWDDRALLDWRV